MRLHQKNDQEITSVCQINIYFNFKVAVIKQKSFYFVQFSFSFTTKQNLKRKSFFNLLIILFYSWTYELYLLKCYLLQCLFLYQWNAIGPCLKSSFSDSEYSPPDLSEDIFLTVCLHPPALAFWHSSVLWGTHLHSPLTMDCSLRSTLWLLDCSLRPAWLWCKNSIVKELCFPLPLTASSFSTFLLVFLPSQHHHSMMIKLLIRNI